MSASSIMQQLSDMIGEPDASEDDVPYWLQTPLQNVNLVLSGRRDGGWPGGRLITISGPESSGKTALATEAVIQGQKQGGIGFLTDFEHAFAHTHARRLGVDYGRFYSKKPNTAEEGFSIAYRVMQQVRAHDLGVTLPTASKADPRAAFKVLSKAIDNMKPAQRAAMRPIVGIMDSIASMIPESQDVDYTMQNMKTKNMDLAAMLSIELKRLARDAEMTKTTVFLLNQLRNNPGIMFGDSTTEPGGNAPKFYASVQVRLRRVDKVYADWGNKDSPIIGDIVELFVRKNKCHSPFGKTRYVFRTADPVGLDPVLTMIYNGKEAGLLGPTTGKTIEFDGKKRWSISDAEAELRSNPALLEKLTDYVLSGTNIETLVPQDEISVVPLSGLEDLVL